MVLLTVAVVMMVGVMVVLWNSSELRIDVGLKRGYSSRSALPLGGAAAFKVPMSTSADLIEY